MNEELYAELMQPVLRAYATEAQKVNDKKALLILFLAAENAIHKACRGAP